MTSDTRKPRPPPRLLLLGGTSRASGLAAIMAARFGPRLEVAQADPKNRAIRARLHDVAALGAHLRARRIGILVEALHPLARVMRDVAFAAAREAHLPVLMLRPPPWPRHPADRWIEVRDAAAARETARRLGRRILLDVDADDHDAFAPLVGHCALVLGAPGPARVADEVRALRRARIEALVLRAGGGRAAGARLAAARRLDLPVVVIRAGPEGIATADTALAASDWIAKLLVPTVGDA